MGVKEAPKASEDLASGSFPAHEATPASDVSTPDELKVVTLSPRSSSEPDTEETSGVDVVRADPYVGCTIDGRYKVEARLGEGGMGVVYRCIHKIIGKRVAMKVLRAGLASDNEATERFLNEAKAASSIGNPHIIDISDFGQLPDGSTYFVMEYLDGAPLSACVDIGKPMPLARIISIAQQLAEALSAAHQAQIVHRDLKPDNVFLISRGQQKDFVKILDFGIAKVSSDEVKLTRAGAVFGTPHYMSPEQAAGTPVDHRGDIYATGVILYELASGRVPFDADNFMGILTQHIYKSPVPMRALLPAPPGVSPGLEAIILKCLSKGPEQRYQSMRELLEDLQVLERGAVPKAVAEVMNRSREYNVPRDYFESKAPLPMPLSEARAALSNPGWRVIAGAGVAALVVAGMVARSTFDDAAPPEVQGSHAVLQPSAAVPVDADSLVADAVVPTTRVVLAVEPIDAHVYRGDADLGRSPVFVDLGDQEQVTVQIEREGFEPKSIVLDGTERKLSVKLSPVERSRPEKRIPARPKPQVRPGEKRQESDKPSIGSAEIIDPWG